MDLSPAQERSPHAIQRQRSANWIAPVTDVVHRERIHTRISHLARLMDNSLRLPGTNYRFGLDPLLGLIPGVGDTATMLVSAYIVFEARRLGVSKGTLLRMVGNIGVDWLIGTIPLLGDVFDFGFKANRRNLDLLQRKAPPRPVTSTDDPRIG